mgnify:CR=1 FL=1
MATSFLATDPVRLGPDQSAAADERGGWMSGRSSAAPSITVHSRHFSDFPTICPAYRAGLPALNRLARCAVQWSRRGRR